MRHFLEDVPKYLHNMIHHPHVYNDLSLISDKIECPMSSMKHNTRIDHLILNKNLESNFVGSDVSSRDTLHSLSSMNLAQISILDGKKYSIDSLGHNMHIDSLFPKVDTKWKNVSLEPDLVEIDVSSLEYFHLIYLHLFDEFSTPVVYPNSSYLHPDYDHMHNGVVSQ